MKVALVHELLTMRGGAEKVLVCLADMFPDAPIYTLLYDERKLGGIFPKERVRTAQSPTPYALLPTPCRLNHHLYLRHFPSMIESFDFSEFDLVISSSSAFAHGIITNGKPKHLCYVNSPARYLWDRTHDIVERAGKGVLGPLKKRYLQRTFHRLRTWDAEAAARPDMLLAASRTVQRRIELYWRRESDVVYPFVDDAWLTQSPTPYPLRPNLTPYFLIVSTLAAYKRIDLAISACNALGVHLKIVGEGPEREKLERLAGPTIEFYGYRQNDELRDLMTDAKALLFPGEEDFGITPLEAMSCGTPVIAYGKGGALETIVEGKTGAFFTDATSQSLQNALAGFRKDVYTREACRARAMEFTRKKFEESIRNAVSQM
ncbi:glycosyltransferase [Candidatus Peregrinibacteria bacterium]|nr:glycosyltransferase [Candidatus Peregrinibacteria bacterium]